MSQTKWAVSTAEILQMSGFGSDISTEQLQVPHEFLEYHLLRHPGNFLSVALDGKMPLAGRIEDTLVLRKEHLPGYVHHLSPHFLPPNLRPNSKPSKRPQKSRHSKVFKKNTAPTNQNHQKFKNQAAVGNSALKSNALPLRRAHEPSARSDTSLSRPSYIDSTSHPARCG